MLKRPCELLALEADNAEQHETIADINKAARDISDLRLEQITATGDLLRSKLAWKLATYQQALLHRLAALFDGLALATNARSTLTAMLAGRAVMETVATFGDLVVRVQKLLNGRDLGGLDALAMRGVFATRDKDLLASSPSSEAQNIMTVLERFEKTHDVDGFYEHYKRLSERCHPNGLGHHFMFGDLDVSTGTVRYSDELDPEDNRAAILTAALSIAFIPEWSKALTIAIREVADLQHQSDPISG